MTYGLFAEQRVLDMEAELKRKLGEQTEAAEKALVSAKGEADAALKLRKEIEDIAESARKAASITAVSAQSEHFQNLAKEYADSASQSLLSAVTIGFLLLILGWFLFADPTSSEPTQMIQKMAGRLVLISIGFTAFVVSLRNYGAAKHNYAVNRHKATTLQTFEAFINGSANREVKEAILLQAAKSAFEPQSSGFLRSEGDGPQFSQITELARVAK